MESWSHSANAYMMRHIVPPSLTRTPWPRCNSPLLSGLTAGQLKNLGVETLASIRQADACSQRAGKRERHASGRGLPQKNNCCCCCCCCRHCCYEQPMPQNKASWTWPRVPTLLILSFVFYFLFFERFVSFQLLFYPYKFVSS